jgi:dihydrofolate reductase
MADGGEIPWGAEPPFRAPVFVVTHRPRPTVQQQGGTSFTYVTDGIDSAIERARYAARDKNVAVAGGGTLLRQVIALGLLDELELHIASHSRRRDATARPPTRTRHLRRIELTPDRVTATDDVTHIRYRVRERRPLVLDNRGRDEQARVA